MKLAAKIILAFFALATLLGAVSAAGYYAVARDAVRRDVSDRLQVAVQLRKENVEAYLDMLKLSAKQLSKSVVLERLLKTGADDPERAAVLRTALSRLMRTQEANPDVFAFILLDAAGRVVVATDGTLPGTDKASDRYFIEGRKGVYLKDVYILSGEDAPLIGASVPVSDSQSGELIGVLLARVRLEKLNHLLTSRTGMGASGETYLVNKYGYIITPSRFLADVVLKKRVAVAHGYRYDASADAKCSTEFDYRGVRVVRAHVHIPEMDWMVVADLDLAEAFAPLRKIAFTFLAILLLTPLLSWFAGGALATRLTRPIRALRDGMERIELGDLDCKVGTSRRDEIGQLSRSFDKMVAGLRSSTTLVGKLNKEIAERIKMEAALKQAQQRTRAFLDETFQLIGMMTVDGILVDVNKAALDMIGAEAFDVVGKRFWDTPWWSHSPDQQAKLAQAVKDAATGKFVRFEATHRDASGKVRYIDFSIKPALDDAGAVIYLIPEGRDITEQKAAVDEIRKAKDYIEILFRLIPSAVFTVGNDKRVTAWNRKAEEITGFSAAEMVGQDCLTFALTPCARKCGLFADDVPKPFAGRECTIRRKDGKMRTILKNADLLRDAEGRVVGGVESFEDITERKAVEETVRRLAMQNDLILDAAGEGIIGLDRSGNHLFVNPAASKMLGYPPGALIGVPSHSAWHHTRPDGTAAPEGECIIHGALKSGHPVHVADDVFWRKDGTGFPVEYTATPMLEGGVPAGIVIVFHDISQRKRVEATIREAMEIKTQFISMVSHELRTPLTAIEEGIGIVLDGSAGTVSKEQREFLDLARRNVDRLSRLINDVLDYQKLEAGKMVFRMQETDLAALVGEVAATMAPVARQKGLTISTRVPPSLPRLICDHDRIMQVLMNLVNNAIKFTEEGGVTIDAAAGAVSLRIAVTDTGPGIREEDIPRLFRDFSQLDTGNARRTGSTGLGLAISKRIVEEHRGAITVESEYGKGASFAFTIPLKTKYTIMIVDDEPDIVDICSRSFRDAGYEVIVSGSGAEAIGMIERARPDLVILDMKLKDTTGFEVIGRLRSNQATASIPILVMSAYVDELGKLQDTRDDSTIASIAKPFPFKDLLSLSRMLLRQGA